MLDWFGIVALDFGRNLATRGASVYSFDDSQTLTPPSSGGVFCSCMLPSKFRFRQA